MAEHHLTTPITDADVEKLKTGDVVFITGHIYTARDAAHKRLVETLDAGKSLPFDLKGALIYYVGPSPAPPGRSQGWPCGPAPPVGLRRRRCPGPAPRSALRRARRAP